ncbi:MAG: TlpA disulfide reductase family protein [Bryobacteraceae bacterium]
MIFRALAAGILAIFICNAAESRLRMEPSQPHSGDTITVTYDPRGGPLEKSAGITLVCGRNPLQSFLTPMQRAGGRFTANLKILDDAYLWCWVEDKDAGLKDTNRGGVWDTYIYDAQGMPLKGAREQRAALYQVRDQPVDKNTAAIMLLEEELRAFPDNAWARAAWWAARLEDAGWTDDARQQISREIAVFRDANLDKPWAYKAAYEGYHRAGEQQKSLEAMRAFVKRFPAESFEDGGAANYFMLYGTTADLEGLPAAYQGWGARPQYWEDLFQAYRRTHAAPEKLRHAGERWLALIPKERDQKGAARIAVAEGWLEGGVDPKSAEAVSREAVDIAETGNTYAANHFPSPMWNARNTFTAINRSTLGWALYHEGRYRDAAAELARAVAIGEKAKLTMRDVYYRLGEALERLDRGEEAMEAYLKEIAWGSDDAAARQAASALYLNAHGKVDGFETEMRSRVNDLIARANTNEEVQDVNQALGRFDLRGPDGPAAPGRYKGKVVLIDYWATWCGPCLTALERTRDLERQFPGKMVVLAVAMDSEGTQARARSYLAEKGYDFVLLFDDEHQRDLRVPFVPSRFLLDRAGRLRVMEFGAGTAGDVVFEQRLRALAAEGN